MLLYGESYGFLMKDCRTFDDFSPFVVDGGLRKVLRSNRFHHYKIHLVQELNNDDYDRHIEFCELLMMERIDKDSNFLSNIVFSDEAIFQSMFS